MNGLDIIAQLRADVLLTAHHLDDQLETIIYRLFTGDQHVIH